MAPVMDVLSKAEVRLKAAGDRLIWKEETTSSSVQTLFAVINVKPLGLQAKENSTELQQGWRQRI